MAEPKGIKRLAPKRKCKFNDDWKRDSAWIAKLPDTGMAQCNLCATDFSVIRYRLVIARMFAAPRECTLGCRRVGDLPRAGCSSMSPSDRMNMFIAGYKAI